MASWPLELRSAEERFEREISERKKRLDRAFRKLEALIERTEKRMNMALQRVYAIDAVMSEMRRERYIARSTEVEEEFVLLPPPLRLSAAVLRPPSLSRSAVASRHQRSPSLDNLQRLLSDRGIELGAEYRYKKTKDHGKRAGSASRIRS